MYIYIYRYVYIYIYIYVRHIPKHTAQFKHTHKSSEPHTVNDDNNDNTYCLCINHYIYNIVFDRANKEADTRR